MPTLESTRGNQNAFDRLLNWIGTLRAQGQDVNALERDILELERIVQTFDIEPLTRTVNIKLEYWLELLLQSSDGKGRIEDQNSKQFFTAIDLHDKITLILSSLRVVKKKPILLLRQINLIAELEPTKYFLSGNSEIFLPLLENENFLTLLERKNSFTLRGNIVSLDILPKGSVSSNNAYESTKPSWTTQEEFKDYQYKWEIFIKFSGDHHRAAKVSKVLWLLAEALESVSGVAVEIEDQGTGSIWFKLRVFILDLLGKDEVRDLLEKSRDAVLAEQVDKRIEGTEKLKEEKLKIQAERSLLERQTELTPDSEEAKKIRKLELRKKELEIREKEADIKRKELENYKATLDLAQQLAYMMKEGMFAAAPVEIKINGETYLSCQDGQFLTGASMDVIDQAGAVKPGEDESP